MKTDLGDFIVNNGSHLHIDFKCSFDEVKDILGIGRLLPLPKYWDYNMLIKSYNQTKHPKLKSLLSLIETGEYRTVVVSFKKNS